MLFDKVYKWMLGGALVIFTIMSCVPKRIPTGPPTQEGPGWVAIEQRGGGYLIVADNELAAERGVKEICSHSYVCQVEIASARYVTRRRK